MGILDDLSPPGPKQWSCKVRTITAQLEPADAEKFIAAVENPEWKLINLAEELRKRGIPISAPTIRIHRDGACSCSRT